MKIVRIIDDVNGASVNLCDECWNTTFQSLLHLEQTPVCPELGCDWCGKESHETS